ncbi:MAG: IPT/TIG domain-containing protein [Gemmatimonadota bacterium]
MTKSIIAGLAIAAVIGSCGGDGTGPDDGGFAIAAQTNETQFGSRNARLPKPLQVIVTDPVTKQPQEDVAVSWRVVEGSATMVAATSTTNDDGVANGFVQLGALGTSVIEASVSKLIGSPARFTVRAVDAPVIISISPGTAEVGDTITITGQNFSPSALDNTVLFGGFRGQVISATTTQMQAVVPLCVPSRTVTVQVLLGAIAGNQQNLAVTGSSTTSALQLARGEARSFGDTNELACFRLPGGVPGLSVLLVPQNFSEVVGSFTAFELIGLTGGGTVTAVSDRPLLTPTPGQDSWELHLRAKERELLKGPGAALRPQYSTTAASCPGIEVGSRCEFSIINRDDKFERITAELKAVTVRALVYQDVRTSATDGLTAADFRDLGAVFDDPIYAVESQVFGAPSDIDGNGRVFILLTPVVNQLTPSGSTGFIAGFFFGCDLLARSQCSGSNEAEIFYALTTNPGNNQFGDQRTRNTVMAALPPVIAHEFQHMINFAQRNKTQDALWLSEGMAHHAEDVIADAFEARGNAASAATFRSQNTVRANRYLRATSSISLLAESNASSLELRGAAWLFVKYLAGQYGNEILGKLTRSSLSSVANVTAQTGKPWNTLLSEWGVALWADNAPELAGVTVRQELTFPNENLRQRLRAADGSYTLKPAIFGFTDFIESGTQPASSQAYVIVSAGTSSPPQLNLTLTGQRGGAFAPNAAPQITVLRIN